MALLGSITDAFSTLDPDYSESPILLEDNLDNFSRDFGYDFFENALTQRQIPSPIISLIDLNRAKQIENTWQNVRNSSMSNYNASMPIQPCEVLFSRNSIRPSIKGEQYTDHSKPLPSCPPNSPTQLSQLFALTQRNSQNPNHNMNDHARHMSICWQPADSFNHLIGTSYLTNPRSASSESSPSNECYDSCLNLITSSSYLDHHNSTDSTIDHIDNPWKEGHFCYRGQPTKLSPNMAELSVFLDGKQESPQVEPQLDARSAGTSTPMHNKSFRPMMVDCSFGPSYTPTTGELEMHYSSTPVLNSSPASNIMCTELGIIYDDSVTTQASDFGQYSARRSKSDNFNCNSMDNASNMHAKFEPNSQIYTSMLMQRNDQVHSPTPYKRKKSTSVTYHTHRRAKSASTSKSDGSGSSTDSDGFINLTSANKREILDGVAPSGSSRTRVKREKEAAEKRKRLAEATRRAVLEAGGAYDYQEFQALVAGSVYT